jgi:hypothetical protein
MAASTLASWFTQILVRYLQARIDAGTTATALLTMDLQRRLTAALLAAIASALFLLTGGAWIIGSVWNTAWRTPVMSAMLVVLALLAGAGVARTLKPYRPDPVPASSTAFPRSMIMRRLLGSSTTKGVSHP